MPRLLRQPPLTLVLQQRNRRPQPRLVVFQLQVRDAHGHGPAERLLPQQAPAAAGRVGLGHGVAALGLGALLRQAGGSGPRGRRLWLCCWLMVLREEVGGDVTLMLAWGVGDTATSPASSALRGGWNPFSGVSEMRAFAL